MNQVMQGHTMRRYDAELEKLEERVLAMGELIIEQFDGLIVVIQEASEEKAEDVVKKDISINKLEIKADKLITRIIARRAPVADDLRFLVAVSRMVNDMEHLGDEASHMARSLLDGMENRGGCFSKNFQDLDELMRWTRDRMRQLMQAFREQDQKLARSIHAGATADSVNGTRLKQMHKNLSDCEDVFQSVDLALVIRSLERFRVNLLNMAEHIVYLISGDDLRVI